MSETKVDMAKVTQMTKEHTPTPEQFKAYITNYRGVPRELQDVAVGTDTLSLCHMVGGKRNHAEALPLAERIAHCLNSHDALVAALKDLEELGDYYYQGVALRRIYPREFDAARAALTLAAPKPEGKP